MKIIMSMLVFLSLGCNLLDKKDDKDNHLKLLLLGVLSLSSSDVNDGSYLDIDAVSGTSVTSNFNSSVSASVQGSLRAITSGTDSQTKVEVSVVDPDGLEQTYLRNGDGSLNVNFTPNKTGKYRINFKNNADSKVDIRHTSTSGASANGDVSLANQNAKFRDIFLKGYVGFSTRCSTFSSNVTASNGSFFVQPIIFLGKVGLGRKVSEITTATIKLSYNGTTLTLQRLDEMNSNLYDNPNNPSNSIPSSDKANKIKFIKSYYQSLFGAAGELYTIGDTFNKSTGSSCSSSSTLPLGTSNFGNSVVTLTIQDSANGIDESMKIRPVTNGTDFSQYFKKADGTSFSDFSTCSYNTSTGSSEGCSKNFSLENPPYIQLTSFTPDTSVSAPTRLLIYGANYPKSFYTQLLLNSSSLGDGSLKSLTIEGCLQNGGINAVKIASSEKIYLPLREFNLRKDDISLLKFSPGTYTHLKNFYQGNADLSGTFDIPICLPSNGQSCPNFKTISINTTKCKVKVDSGLIVGAFSSSPAWTAGDNNYFIYPDNLGGGLSARITE